MINCFLQDTGSQKQAFSSHYAMIRILKMMPSLSSSIYTEERKNVYYQQLDLHNIPVPGFKYPASCCVYYIKRLFIQASGSDLLLFTVEEV